MTGPLTDAELNKIENQHDRVSVIGGVRYCAICADVYPCPTARAVGEIDRLRAKLAEVEYLVGDDDMRGEDRLERFLATKDDKHALTIHDHGFYWQLADHAEALTETELDELLEIMSLLSIERKRARFAAEQEAMRLARSGEDA